MSYQIIDGCPSTSGDNYQLNTISIMRSAAKTYPDVEIVSREKEGSNFRYNYERAYGRMMKLANALKNLGIKPGDRIGVMEWNTYRHFELYFAISGMGAVVLQMNLRLSAADLASGPPELQCPRERPAGLERGSRQFDRQGSIWNAYRFSFTRPLLDHRNLPGALGPNVLSWKPCSPAGF